MPQHRQIESANHNDSGKPMKTVSPGVYLPQLSIIESLVMADFFACYH